jgi:ATP-dependent Clp protease adaptor protein ClpS
VKFKISFDANTLPGRLISRILQAQDCRRGWKIGIFILKQSSINNNFKDLNVTTLPLGPVFAQTGAQDLPEELHDTLEQTREKIDEPPQYVVYLLNDDYTTFDFVVQVLVRIFKKSIEEAVKITNDVHHKGKGACGIYPRQIAETKVALVEEASSSAGFPLKCVLEEA